MLIIRNRLAALLGRILMFGGTMAAFILYFIEMSPAWRALCFFEVQAGLIFLAMLALEIIFNAIDMRHGASGVAAGLYPPFMLMITGYCFLGSILYFSYIMPQYGYLTLRSILFNSALLLFPLLNWLLFEIKGTVPYFYIFLGVAYPLIYMFGAMFRAIIWPNDALFTPNVMFVYHFLDPSHPSFPWAIWVSLAALLSFLALIVLANDLLARKWRRRIPQI